MANPEYRYAIVEEGELLRTSNPKAATLTAAKMATLWNLVRIQRKEAVAVSRDQRRHIQAFSRFRQKWGGRPPVSADDWREFWLDLFEVQDAAFEIDVRMAQIAEELNDLADDGLEVVSQNGFEAGVGDPLDDIRRALKRAEALVEKRQEWFAEHGYPDEEE